MKLPKRDVWVLVILYSSIGVLVGLVLHFGAPLAPLLDEKFSMEARRPNELLMKRVSSTGVPFWEIVDGVHNVRVNSHCPDRGDYDPDYAFLRWPEKLTPPNFQTSWYAPSTTEGYHFLVRGKLVGCQKLDEHFFPVFRVNTWVTGDKMIYFSTDAGETCGFLLVVLAGLSGLAVILTCVAIRDAAMGDGRGRGGSCD